MTTITGNAALDKLAQTATKSGKGNLDQTAFLKLMTTQLKTQDPFAPVDNTQMVAQMAQFSSVAGIAEMNQSLKAIASGFSGGRIADLASWIGRAALVKTDTAGPLADGSYAGEIDLATDATAVSVSLVDADGQVVHSEELGAVAKGSFGFAFDGKAPDGSTVTGPLKIVVSAKDAKGKVAATTSSWTAVNGVQSPAGTAAKLVTALGLIDPADTVRLG